MNDQRPIGFFDSGIGGLTVLRSAHRQFADENFVYLGDTARLPYGTKSSDTIFKYTLQNIKALCRLNVKAIVIACNSASTSVLQARLNQEHNQLLEKALRGQHGAIPLFNVIEPGAESALKVSLNKRIGVVGTRATVDSKAYPNALASLDSTVNVFQIAAPLLVPLVEEGWETDPITNLVVYRYLTPLLSEQVDTLILGCTHYPALFESFRRTVGPGIQLVDSALAITNLLQKSFQEGVMQSNTSNTPGTLTLYATDRSTSMNLTAQRLMATPDKLDFQPFDIV